MLTAEISHSQWLEIRESLPYSGARSTQPASATRECANDSRLISIPATAKLASCWRPSTGDYPGSGTWLLSDLQLGIRSRGRSTSFRLTAHNESGSELPGDVLDVILRRTGPVIGPVPEFDGDRPGVR
jgi:hypothetical protein